MIKNSTIDKQVTHKTIRAFKDQTLTKDQLTTLVDVARHTSSSMFMQQFSILHITDEQKRMSIRQISGQKYVGANGDLFIFVVDLHRNQSIRHQLGKDDGRLHQTDIFLQGVEDTVLAVQNMVNAAESMGLGAVILGSVNNNPKELLEVLNLPKMTFPILGLQVGIADQKPQLKPRLPLDAIFFENDYHEINVSDLKEYDEVVQTYYDLRDSNRRIDSFTKQVSSKKLGTKETLRDELLEVLHEQGLCLK
ncbi:MAG: NADPH-dependent oxidoreductase [Liquorilactobacillus mali]|uniref:NADPH-dependent oxidoreductase n=1 Tax=Liquorilactobacillus mali TaxID=1618 RepID=UPI0039EBF9A3